MSWFLSLGWFLKLWIISTIISFFVGEISTASILREIKRDYVVTDKKSSIAESIRARLAYIVPFINLIICLMWIFMYEKFKDEGIEKAKQRGVIFDKENL